MKQVSAIILFLLLCCACNKSTKVSTDDNVIVQVGNNTLTKSELEDALSTGMTPEDSMIIAENFIENWVRDALMYDVALDNINNKAEIDQLVDNYRKSLITYQYQEQLIAEKMSGEITEAEMKNYYEENKDKFKLESTLIKGLFLKVPMDAPQINNIKEWYKSPSIKDIEKIEKYSVQNAVNYDYFYDRWINWDEIMELFPAQNQYSATQLRQQKQFEVRDSAFYYFLNVKDALFAGENQPYEHAKPSVKNMIINQKRLDFIKKFESDLYQTAKDKGLIKRKKE